MESRTSDIVKRSIGNVSPYQSVLNEEGKYSILFALQNKLYFIWAVPALLTLSEVIYIRHNQIGKANRLSLFKWISYVLAASASNFASGEAIRRVDYFNRLYPKPPQIQIEEARDAEILKRTEKI